MEIRVLIVEDEKAVREPMVEFLCYKEVPADGVPDGPRGLKALKAAEYNLRR